MKEELIVNCLHLDYREDRKALILEQAKQQGFYIRFWEGIENQYNRKMGICQGHKAIIRDAKENGYPYCCVMEDDTAWFAPGAWDYFLSTMPEDADIYFAMVYVATLEENRIISVFSGMTCYIIYERFYDFVLNTLPDDCHIDRELGSHWEKFKFIVCDKFCCEQIGGKSNNTQTTIESYRPFLKGRKIFGDVKID